MSFPALGTILFHGRTAGRPKTRSMVYKPQSVHAAPCLKIKFFLICVLVSYHINVGKLLQIPIVRSDKDINVLKNVP